MNHAPYIDTEPIHPDSLQQMRDRGGTWYAFQNHELGHSHVGALQFLQCGEGRTYTTPPARMPDTARAINWRYILVGRVDLETGAITPIEEQNT